LEPVLERFFDARNLRRLNLGAPGPDFGTWDTTTHGQNNFGQIIVLKGHEFTNCEDILSKAYKRQGTTLVVP
jgi:hypothetical protein